MVDRIIQVPKEPKRKETQYGILYPDNTISWHNLEDIQTSHGRKQERENYIHRCQQLGVLPGRLRFVKRIIKTSYSLPEILAGS